MEISYSDLGPNRKINEERKDINSRTPKESMTFTAPIVTKLMLARQIF